MTRVLITLDINDDDLGTDTSMRDITDGLIARLGEFYPNDDGREVRASVVNVTDS